MREYLLKLLSTLLLVNFNLQVVVNKELTLYYIY